MFLRRLLAGLLGSLLGRFRPCRAGLNGQGHLVYVLVIREFWRIRPLTPRMIRNLLGLSFLVLVI